MSITKIGIVKEMIEQKKNLLQMFDNDEELFLFTDVNGHKAVFRGYSEWDSMSIPEKAQTLVKLN